MKTQSSNERIDYHSLENRLNDYLKAAKYRKNCSYDFLTPLEIRFAKDYLASRTKFQVYPDDDESINKCIFIPEYDDSLVTLEGIYDPRNKVNQRNLFGALMSLNLNRSRIGDVWIENDKAYIITKRELAEVIRENLISFGKAPVSFHVLDELKTPNYSYEKSNYIVSSVRLDNIVKCCARTSREKAQAIILKSSVNVNYESIEKTSFLCNNYDIISISQVGRFRIGKIIEKSNEKYLVEIWKFI